MPVSISGLAESTIAFATSVRPFVCVSADVFDVRRRIAITIGTVWTFIRPLARMNSTVRFESRVLAEGGATVDAAVGAVVAVTVAPLVSIPPKRKSTLE